MRLGAARESTIATTSPDYAVAVLDALALAGVEFAVLHGADAIAAGSVTSDIDVVVGGDPTGAIYRSRQALADSGLLPVVFWPYDVASTGTLFLATESATDGVQLDLLNDPRGVGLDGIRSDSLLEHRVDGSRWPVLPPLHGLLYLIRKRDRKLDDGALHQLVLGAREYPDDEVAAAARIMFRPGIAERVIALVQTGSASRERAAPAAGHRLRESRRWVNRLLNPIGCWAHLDVDDPSLVARRVASRFTRMFPYVGHGAVPGRGRYRWYWRDVAPVRWRAGLYVSFGDVDSRPLPDVRVGRAARSTADVAEQIVSWMTHRLAKMGI